MMNENKLQKYKLRILSDFPQLDIASISLIGFGWHHVALEVNNSIVFRLPREVHVKDLSSTVRYETKILHQLQNKLPVAIPNPLYIASDHSYFGYPKLEGKILEKIIGNFDDNAWTQLLEDWVDVASDIHNEISVDKAKRLGVPDFDGFDTSMAEKILHISGVDRAILDFAQNIIQRVKSLNKADQQWVFIHNDLQFHNLLADPKSKKLTGIIDWTDVCIAPIAREFATGEFIQNDRLQRATDLYEKKTGIRVDGQQAIMWRAIEEVSDYVEELESNEIKEAAATLERLKNLIKVGSYL